MSARSVSAVAAVLFGAALSCGGKIAGDSDASTTTDASNGTCGPIALDAGSGVIDPGGACEVSASWSCGATSYFVDCTCGIAEKNPQCECSKTTSNSASGSSGPTNACMCTNGSTAADLAAQCGFPH